MCFALNDIVLQCPPQEKKIYHRFDWTNVNFLFENFNFFCITVMSNFSFFLTVTKDQGKISSH